MVIIKKNEHIESDIALTSTSKHTAKAKPIILNKTERVLLQFEPEIVDNSIDQKKSVKGKLVYSKKREKEKDFPSHVNKGSLKVGEYMDITLDTTETYKLFEGLQVHYEFYNKIGNIPSGTNEYIKADKQLASFIDIFKKHSTSTNSEKINTIKSVIEIITQNDNQENLISSLQLLQNTNIEQIKNAVDITNLLNIHKEISSNMNNSDEEFWQKLFTNNQWVISQIASTPMTIFANKGYVGGKDISNCGGNLCDFIFKNNLSDNISLIEIKTPTTSIIGSKYRQVSSLSADLSGSINQILNYKNSITKDYYSISAKSEQNFKVLSPKCFIVIGKMNKLDTKQKDVFEDFRNSLSHINIITFDELLMKINFLINLLTEKTKVEDTIEEEVPF